MIKAKIKLRAIALLFTVWFGLLPLAPQLAYSSTHQEESRPTTFAQINSSSNNNPAPVDDEEAGAPLQSTNLVEPGEARFGVYDRYTPNITLDFPVGAISEPVEVKAYYDALPANVSPPPSGIVGSPFYLGVWINGQGRTVDRFHQSIVVHVEYEESSPAQVDLSMYDPISQEWIKLCSRNDPYLQVVSAALLLPTPLKPGGNALLAITVDNTPELEQRIDNQGNTVLSVPTRNSRLNVVAGAVEKGTFFEVTGLPKASSNGLVQLLPTPVDIKVCRVNEANEVHQVAQISRPLIIEFGYDPTTISRAGGKGNITIVQFENGQWIDMEELGIRVMRGNASIVAETSRLSPFGMVIR